MKKAFTINVTGAKVIFQWIMTMTIVVEFIVKRIVGLY